MLNHAIAKLPVLDKGEVALISFTGTDESIAAAARVSYKKGTKQVSTDKQLIRYLVRNLHTSPLEQTFLQFYLKLPIFVMRQWMRHRTWSYNEISGRYSEIVDEAYVPLPEHLTGQDAKNKQMRTDTRIADAVAIKEAIEQEQNKAFSTYKGYLQSGLAREIARIDLPLATYTEVIASVDLHNLLHFLKLRMHPHAQYEIRCAAEAIFEIVKGLFPACFEAWEDCVLNAFTLTGSMQGILGDAIATFGAGCKYYNGDEAESYDKASWPIVVQETANRYTWASKSEKDQFISWCVTRLKVS